MNRRRFVLGLAGFASISLIGRFAYADDSYTCADVRAAVATVARGASVDRSQAIEIIAAMARGAGATEDQIQKARRCLPSSSR